MTLTLKRADLCRPCTGFKDARRHSIILLGHSKSARLCAVCGNVQGHLVGSPARLVFIVSHNYGSGGAVRRGTGDRR